MAKNTLHQGRAVVILRLSRLRECEPSIEIEMQRAIYYRYRANNTNTNIILAANDSQQPRAITI